MAYQYHQVQQSTNWIPIIVGIILVLVVLIGVVYFYYTPSASESSAPPPPPPASYPFGGEDQGDWVFFPNKWFTEPSGTIKLNTSEISVMKERCASNPACKAFTSSAWGYQGVQSDVNQWSDYAVGQSGKGMYVRKELAPTV